MTERVLIGLLEGSPYHRLLHIFCCPQLKCQYNSERYDDSLLVKLTGSVCSPLSDSWVVLRSQERETITVPSEPTVKVVKRKWCVDEDDWGSPPRLVFC